MLFNSYIFILLFLPVTLILYFGLNAFHKTKAAKVALLGMSLWFYAYFQINYLLIIVCSVVGNYLISKLIGGVRQSFRKGIFILGILGNLGAIFYYKYFNFFLDNLNILFHQNFVLRNILMPLGISFFTFQQISYLVDSYRGETKEYGFLDYALFVTFFPQLVAGPIVMHSEMIPQFQDPRLKKFDQGNLARGIWLFAVGLFKKVLLADTLGGAVDYAFSVPEQLSALETVVSSFLFTFQIYFDFSGYCDMACGIAAMFNMQLPINFNSPYKALSVRDFWDRWHITLTRFLRKYVYFPLGGSRKGKIRTYLNVISVFLISGIWHGANWTFILWGLIYGGANVLERLTSKIWEKVPKAIRWGVTFIFVNVMWTMFRADSLKEFIQLAYNCISKKPGGLSYVFEDKLKIFELSYVEDHIHFLHQVCQSIPGWHIWIMLVISAFLVFIPQNCHEHSFKPSVKNAALTVVLLVWSILSLSGVTVFLYFNF